MCHSLPSTIIGAFTTISVFSPSLIQTGTSSGFNIGAPISTFTDETIPSSPIVRSMYFFFPALTITRFFLVVSPLSYTYFATHLMPFPHISEREPSALYISISKSMLSSSTGFIKIRPSEPIPKCLSETLMASSDFFS